VHLYKDIFYKDGLGGFDKKLQIELVQRVKQVGFAKDCIVYDEKVEDYDKLEKQRTRWINSYFKYFNESALLFFKGMTRFNMSQVLIGLVMLRPPLFITFFIAYFFMLIGFIFKPVFGIAWCILIFLFALSFILIIITQSKEKKIVQSLAYIPKILILQVKALFKIKHANKSFLKTEHHNIIYIDELLNNK